MGSPTTSRNKASRQDLPFVVVGCGIGGLSVAVALARRGFSVRLIEQADELREIGAGIQLGPNAFRALNALGLDQAVLADAWRPTGQEMRDALTGALVTRIPVGEEFERHFGAPYAVTHRGDLYKTLLQAARASHSITIDTGSRVEGYLEENGHVRVHVSSGAQVLGRAVIGADGLWSKMRSFIVRDGAPVVSGHIAHRAVLKREDVPADLWNPDIVLWAGPRTHLVHYPLRRGDLFNLVAVFHSQKYVEGWNTVGDHDELMAHFAGQRPEVLRLLERIETWRMWVLCDREPVKNWTVGLATLVGDAAHPMLQYLAQGACMALEDAVCLAEELAATPDSIADAFCRYQKARYLRTAKVQVMARVYGDFYHAAGVKAELRAIHLGNRPPTTAYASSDWLYGPGQGI